MEYQYHQAPTFHNINIQHTYLKPILPPPQSAGGLQQTLIFYFFFSRSAAVSCRSTTDIKLVTKREMPPENLPPKSPPRLFPVPSSITVSYLPRTRYELQFGVHPG